MPTDITVLNSIDAATAAASNLNINADTLIANATPQELLEMQYQQSLTQISPPANSLYTKYKFITESMQDAELKIHAALDQLGTAPPSNAQIIDTLWAASTSPHWTLPSLGSSPSFPTVSRPPASSPF